MRPADRVVRVVIGAGLALLAAGCGGGTRPPDTLSFHSRPDLAPPVVRVVTDTGAEAPGYIFIAPKQNATEKGPLILDNEGRPVWFGPVSEQALDFRVQSYEGKPVLTWWEGPPQAPVLGTGLGHGVIMDSSYHRIARVDTGFGPDSADLHEFKLTPRGTALMTAVRIVPADLSPVGGPAHGKAVDGIAQEVDVRTGKVLFSWHSLGHVALAESHAQPPPESGKGSDEPYDYFHINSVDEEPDGNLLISARNTWGVYEVDRHTGKILWRLGGKRSDFKMGPGARFAWQHDARRQPDGTITIFDDGAAPAVEGQSRAIQVRLDLQAKTATLVRADVSPARVLAASQGNVQVLGNGDWFVGWGAVPRFTEFDHSGKVVYDATFSEGDDSYRAYRFPWQGTPTSRPSIAVQKGYGTSLTAYASWNGATEVAAWRVVGGINADNLRPLDAGTRRTGFETAISLHADQPLYAVEALDAAGHVLATSAAVPAGGLAEG